VADLTLDKHLLSEAFQNSLKSARRRELAAWLQDTSQISYLPACPSIWPSLVAPPDIDKSARRINPRCGCAFTIWLVHQRFGHL